MNRIQSTSRHLQRLDAAGVLLSCLVLLVACKAQQAVDAPVTGDVSMPADVARDPASSCPSQNFPEFLRAFASQPAVRDAFTDGRIWAQEFSDPDTYTVARVQVDKAQYSGFNLVAAADGFHASDGSDSVDPTPIKVDIQRQKDATYVVSYELGSSEGRSYLFVPGKNCWVLAEDLTAPSP